MHARFQDAYAFFMEGWIEAEAKEEQEFRRYLFPAESSFVDSVSGDMGWNGNSFLFFFLVLMN